MAVDHVSPDGDVLVLVLQVHRIDAQGDFPDAGVLHQLVGVRARVVTIIERAAHLQARDAQVVQASHIGRRGEIVGLKDALLAARHPSVAVKAIGVQTGDDLRPVIETAIAFAERTEELDPGLVPGGGDDRRLALGPGGAEEVDRLMMLVRQANRHDDMPGTHIKSGMDQARDVELLQGDLAALLHLGLVLAVLRILDLVSAACPTGLELDLRAQDPLGIELIVERQDKTGDRDLVAVIPRASLLSLRPPEAVNPIVHEIGQHLAIAAKAELIETARIKFLCPSRGGHLRLLRQQRRAREH